MNWYFFLTLSCAVLGGCETPPTKVDPNKPTELCVIRPKEGICWKDKKKGSGVGIDTLDGDFAVSPEDLDEILWKLKECKGGRGP